MNRRTLIGSLIAMGLAPVTMPMLRANSNDNSHNNANNHANKHTSANRAEQETNTMQNNMTNANMSKASNLKHLNDLPSTDKMPVLFLGHGSPLYAIVETEFGKGFADVAKKIPKPSAILCISAHWLSNGSWITAMEQPRTIHDFGGFPQALQEFQYPVDGHPMLAQKTHDLLENANYTAHLDQHEWGLDHGTWSVLTHMYPEADVPVVQLSMDYFKTPEQHYHIAQQLASLRKRGVLIVGSGNVVHNLMLSGADDDFTAFDWAIETDEKIKQFIRAGDHKSLINYRQTLGKGGELSIPTNEHYLPLLYSLALQDKSDDVMIFNDKAINGAISMTSVALGI